MSRKIQRPSLWGDKKRYFKTLKKFLFVFVLSAIFLYGTIFLLPIVPGKTNTADSSAFKVKIRPQSSLAGIAEQLREQGIEVGTYYLQISAKALFIASTLKPGTYLLKPKASLGSVLLQFSRGDRFRESIAIIPGMTIWQVRALLDVHPSLVHQTKGWSSKELLQALNLNYQNAEGLFLPDTYIFDPDDSDLSIYKRASQAMQKQLSSIWEKRADGLPLKSPYDALILASIVEKETGKLSDRGMISAVFINRLTLGMPLQTDPTVIYGIGPNFDGNLRKADLRKDSPYNTYMHKGLTPSPISMPSKESLQAATHPDKSNVLYFVAKGDGGSHFSVNLKQHEAAVDQYQRKITQGQGAK